MKLEAISEQSAEEKCEYKTKEVTGRWRKLHKIERHNLYYLPNIVRAIISRRMRKAGGRVSHMGK
jgi:hypothetical protein